MKKIIIKQYSKEPTGHCGVGSARKFENIYQYGIDFNGDWSHLVNTTEEAVQEMVRVFEEAGYEVEFIQP